MGLLRHLRLAITGAAILSSMAGQVSSTSSFQFPDCIDKCISKTDCTPTNGICLCKEAKGAFLETVLACMYFNCKPDLAVFDKTFLNPMAEGCSSIKREIPNSKLKAAKAMARSLLAKLSTATATATTTSSSRGKPQTQTQSTTATTSAASTSSASGIIRSTSTAEVTKIGSSSQDNAVVSTEPTSTLLSSTESQSTSPASPGPDFVDTSPFSNTNSADPQNTLPIALLGLPMVVVLLWR